jgi:predicted CopG family antitoxin
MIHSTNSSQMSSYKNIRITKNTYERLSKLGTLEDTFDTVIMRLMEERSK